jgi:predicted alpha/beta superfamily hydrolase
MQKVLLFFGLWIIISVNLYSQDYGPLILNSAHTRTIKSNFVEGMEYVLDIALPYGYEDTSKTFTVVYMLDAYEVFGLQLQTYQQLFFFRKVPPLILVGLNYKIEGKSFYDGLQDYLYIRSRDFTPTFLSHYEVIEKHGENFASYVKESGGIEKFYRFLQDELFPFIESEYRVDPNDRGIFSYSLGGLFSTYVLFKYPSTFQKYFIGSPGLWWDDEVVFNYYDGKKLNELKSPVQVYLSSQELEGKRLKDSWSHLKEFLEQHENPNLQLQTEVFQGETHLTGVGHAHSRAFRRLYGIK